jgi:hypothetical protein
VQTRGRIGRRRPQDEASACQGAAASQEAISAAGTLGKQYTWSIYHIKGTPAALLGRVEAPDEETAIRKAIDEFQIGPALQKRLLAQRR